MDASYLSILRTNYFRCVFRYYYVVNANTVLFLFQKTNKFFRHVKGKPLDLSDHFEFVNLWYVTIIINDILTVVGSGYKIQIEGRVSNVFIYFFNKKRRACGFTCSLKFHFLDIDHIISCKHFKTAKMQSDN